MGGLDASLFEHGKALAVLFDGDEALKQQLETLDEQLKEYEEYGDNEMIQKMVRRMERQKAHLERRIEAEQWRKTIVYDRLERAKQIHEEAALGSASWGLFQIMGYHYQSLNYPTIKQFVSEMQTHERDHLEAFGNH